MPRLRNYIGGYKGKKVGTYFASRLLNFKYTNFHESSSEIKCFLLTAEWFDECACHDGWHGRVQILRKWLEIWSTFITSLNFYKKHQINTNHYFYNLILSIVMFLTSDSWNSELYYKYEKIIFYCNLFCCNKPYHMVTSIILFNSIQIYIWMLFDY